MNRSIRIAFAFVSSAVAVLGVASSASALKPGGAIGGNGTVTVTDPPTTTTTIPHHHFPIVNLPPNIGVFDPGTGTPPPTDPPTTTSTTVPAKHGNGGQGNGANGNVGHGADNTHHGNAAADPTPMNLLSKAHGASAAAHGAVSPLVSKSGPLHSASTKHQTSNDVWFVIVAAALVSGVAAALFLRARRRHRTI